MLRGGSWDSFRGICGLLAAAGASRLAGAGAAGSGLSLFPGVSMGELQAETSLQAGWSFRGRTGVGTKWMPK